MTKREAAERAVKDLVMIGWLCSVAIRAYRDGIPDDKIELTLNLAYDTTQVAAMYLDKLNEFWEELKWKGTLGKELVQHDPD